MSDPNEEIGKKYKIGHFHGHIRRPECPLVRQARPKWRERLSTAVEICVRGSRVCKRKLHSLTPLITKKSDIPISLPTKWWVSEVLNSKGKAILLNVPNEAYAKILNRILRRRNLNKSSLLEDLDLRQVRCPWVPLNTQWRKMNFLKNHSVVLVEKNAFMK